MSCGIYKITNIINKKCYIGQSTNIENRWQRHLNATDNFAIHQAFRKYGINNFTFTILEECAQEQLNEKEIYWIDYYNSIEDGYNMIPGGSNGAGYAKGIKVEQYTLDGQFLASYNSAKQASEQTGVTHSDICRCCRSEQAHAGIYQWKYTNTNKIIKPIQIDETHIQRPINQYDLKGIFIQQYNSLAEAARQTGISKSTICNVCKGKGKSAGGFRWSYSDKPLILDEIKTGPRGKKTVYQYDKNGNFIQQYESLTEASQRTGIHLSSIGDVCNGKRKTAGKYIWKYDKNK